MTDTIKIGSKAQEKVNCTNCGKAVSVEDRYSYKGKKGEDIYFCKDCRELINKQLKEETLNPNLGGALLGGVLGGILGGFIWYIFVVTTQREIGYLAIGVGYLIGFATFFGAGKKKGKSIQNISALITLMTIFISEYFIFMHFFKEELIKEVGIDKATLAMNKINITPFNSFFLKSILSPIGLLIWAIGIYIAYRFAKPHKI